MDHSGDAPGGGSAQRVDQHQQFHQVVIGRIGRGLDDINIISAHVFLNFDKDFLISKPAHVTLGQGDTHMQADGYCFHRSISSVEPLWSEYI